MTEGVPLPSVHPSTLTSQAERHKTSRFQLSSSLDFHLHTHPTAHSRLPSDTPQHLSQHPLSPQPLCVGLLPSPHQNSALQQQENNFVSYSSGLNHALSLVSWFLILCEAAETVGKRALQPRPSPLLKKQQMWQKRRGGERNTILLTPPSLIWENNTQLPAGVGQLLSLSQSSRSRA